MVTKTEKSVFCIFSNQTAANKQNSSFFVHVKFNVEKKENQ